MKQEKIKGDQSEFTTRNLKTIENLSGRTQPKKRISRAWVKQSFNAKLKIKNIERIHEVEPIIKA